MKETQMSAAFLKSIGGRTIKLADCAVNMVILIAILLMLAFGGYALWDSENVASSAEATHYETYKPSADGGLSFAELKAINPDTFGWLTIYGTPIDYPVLQGEDNSKYINTNAEGEYSLTGALFLHYLNDRSFADFNSIIYGHNMTPNVMFGSIKEFKDKEYFDSHKYGSLYFDGAEHGLELFALIAADAYDSGVYTVGVKGEAEKKAYLENLLSKAVLSRETDVDTNDRIVLLSTCSTDSTNGRDILIGRITEEIFENEFITAEPERALSFIDDQSGRGFLAAVPDWAWLLAALLLALIIAAVVYRIARGRRRGKKNG